MAKPTDKKLSKLSLDEKKALFKKLLKEKASAKSTSKSKNNTSPVTNEKEAPITTPAAFTAPELFPEVAGFKKRYTEVFTRIPFNPFFKVNEGTVNDLTKIAGKELISFSSYNYLGFSGDKAVVKAAQEATGKFGTSVSASRIATGEKPLHQELEKELADFLDVDDALVFVSGHATNVTTIGHLFNPKDLILYDSIIHNSTLQGCLLSGARRIPFNHNDWSHLESLLKQNRGNYEKVLIVIEGVYSMDGDVPNLPQFIALKKKYKAVLMVDEAHSTGVLGETGRGIGEHFNIDFKDVDIWMGTLSKSLASCGGYIAGSEFFIKYLRYTAPGFLYSVGISPANAAASLTALQILKQEPERVNKLQDNSEYFLQKAKESGFDTGLSNGTAVVPIIIGDSDKSMMLSNFLFDQGINVQPVLHPAVEESSTRLRFFITSLHTHAQIDYTIDKLKEGFKKIGI